MRYLRITNDRQLRQWCRGLSRAESVAFDTEFVSEHTYRPVLCLVQMAAGGQLAVIDAMAVEDLTPFWEAVAEPGRQTIVHAGRGEVEFCLRAIGRRPAGLVDVQIAAGLVGIEYRAAYATLTSKLLDEPSTRRETRTDWRRRPLTRRQIEYALDDVRYLHRIHEALEARLVRLGRRDWLAEEMAAWQDEVERSLSEQRWRRVSGGSGLDPRQLAVVRELWRWREGEAARRNKPARRVLRDDLIIELARRGTADPGRIRAVRGLERGDLRRRLDEIAACVDRGLTLPEKDCPQVVRRPPEPKHSVLGQLLFSALGGICRQAQLAPGLVGTPADVRELIAYRASHRSGISASPSSGQDGGRRRKPPRLARGWRAELVGRLFDDLLAGKMAIRIAEPASENPLVFERVKTEGTEREDRGG